MNSYSLLTMGLLCILLVACREEGNIDQACLDKSRGQFPDQATSAYRLPWLPGEAYTVGKGNCASKGGHLEGTSGQFAYDFLMPIGTTILAAREGVVQKVEESNSDGTRVKDEGNVIIIQHYDDSVALYGHLTIQGALVDEGDVVAAGQPIGLSGDSGASSAPHLHFHVQTACFSGSESCVNNQPLPVTFKNTSPHPNGLIQGEKYYALPWE